METAAIRSDDHQRQQLEQFLLVGNCLIAEVHRLWQKTPVDFVNPAASRFSRLLTDFTYFENQQKFEAAIEESDDIRLLEDDFYGAFNPFLRGFHKLVDEICGFLLDLVDYSERCQACHNLLDRNSIKLNSLKCEVLYLAGVVLLLLDSKFPGAVKERIFVAYYRSSVDLRSKHFELLVSLLRRRAEGFESCLSSVRIHRRFVEHVVTFLKNYTISSGAELDVFTTDRQAAVLYVALYFHPDMLHSQSATMRQVVDKYFHDRWILPLHFELSANLIEKWAPFDAARTVLSAALDKVAIGKKALDLGTALRNIVLPSGLLAVDQIGEYGRLVFELNASLRWLLLHSAKASTDSKVNLPQIVQTASRFSTEALFTEFVKSAHFEHKFRQSCAFLVAHKEEECARLKQRIGVLFDQIVQLLGNDLFESQSWNERLSAWMIKIRDYIASIDVLATESPQILEHLIGKVEEVADQHDAENKILCEYLGLVLSDLKKLWNITLIDAEFLSKFDETRDACFVWDLLPSWSTLLERLLQKDATGVKFVFLKLSNSIVNALADIAKPFSDSANVLSEFYHRKLEFHLRQIIQTIPRSIFTQMDVLHPLFSTSKAVHVDKIHLKQFAALDRRRQLAQKTYEITKLSLGISSMGLNRLGPIRIYPKKLLFDGLKQELRLKLTQLLGEDLAAPNVLRILSLQTQKIATFREAFLFVCEHIGFDGVVLWQSELEAVWNKALAIQKSNLKAKQEQPDSPPVTHAKGVVVPPKPILGQVIQTMVQQTNPRSTIYYNMRDEWLSLDCRRLEFSADFFTAVERWLPAMANIGLRRLVVFSIHRHMQTFIAELTASSSMFDPLPEIRWPSLSPLLESTEFTALARNLCGLAEKIGQLSALEGCLSKSIEESLHARVETVLLATTNLVQSLALDQRLSNKRGANIDGKAIAKSTDFVNMLDRLGLADLITKPPSNVPSFAAIVIFGSLMRYLAACTSYSKKPDYSDCFVVVSGLVVIARSLRVEKALYRLVSRLMPDSNINISTSQFANVRSILKFGTVGVY
uniref:DUF2428 domain-containing protein n=1 Tax=Panagrellus redivivus TaxID=6233 RepID=A0A7E5A2D2_PANRE